MGGIADKNRQKEFSLLGLLSHRQCRTRGVQISGNTVELVLLQGLLDDFLGEG